MLTIRTTTSNHFDLFPGTKLSIEENSPMFSDAGSFSLPLELPETDNNLQILEYPHRADRRKRFITSLDVVITCGVWIRHARMDIESAGKRKNITTSLFFRESPFYQKIKNKRLPDIFKNKIRNDFEELGSSQLAFWHDYLNEVMCGDAVDDFFIFPVCAKIEEKEVSEGDQNISLKTTYTRYTILNRQIVNTKDFGGSIMRTLNNKEYYELVGTYQAYTDDGIEYNLPRGYGKCPFLKFTYVVRYMFQQLGYGLEQSVFDTDIGFQRLCFIHNTADCLIRGFLDYSQLVPDIEVSDFLKFIENSFGLRFIIDEAKKTATPRFWKDVISESPAFDISETFEDSPVTTFADSKSLNLTVEKVADTPSQSGMSTFSELFEKYGDYQGSFQNKMALNVAMTRGDVNQGVYLVQDSGIYYAVFKYYPDRLNQPGIYDWVSLPVETEGLVYSDHDATNFEDRPLGFYLVDMKYVALSGQTDMRHQVTVAKALKFMRIEEVLQQMFDKFKTDDGLIGKIPFINSIRHLNSVLETTSTKDGESTTSVTEEKETNLPVFLAFAHGFAVPDTDIPKIERTFYASPDAYNNIGSKVGTFDLSTRSLYANFWVDYDKLLRNSFHQISGYSHLSLSEAMNISFDSPYTLDGQKVLLESIQYEISDTGIEVVELRVKTIKAYE